MTPFSPGKSSLAVFDERFPAHKYSLRGAQPSAASTFPDKLVIRSRVLPGILILAIA
jgi:hypothetical protein